MELQSHSHKFVCFIQFVFCLLVFNARGPPKDGKCQSVCCTKTALSVTLSNLFVESHVTDVDSIIHVDSDSQIQNKVMYVALLLMNIE